jgi:hypothetical protein
LPIYLNKTYYNCQAALSLSQAIGIPLVKDYEELLAKI